MNEFFAPSTRPSDYVTTYSGARYSLGFLCALMGLEDLHTPVQYRSGLKRGVEFLAYALPEPDEQRFLVSYPGHLGDYTPSTYLTRILEEWTTLETDWHGVSHYQRKYLLPNRKFLEPFFVTATVLEMEEGAEYETVLELVDTALALLDKLNPHRPPHHRAY